MEDLSYFIECCELIVGTFGSPNPRELLREKAGCTIPYQDQNVIFYIDDKIRIALSLDSGSFVLTKLENDNPVVWRDSKGNISRYHGEVLNVKTHLMFLYLQALIT